MRRSVYAITAVFLLALAGCDLTTGPDSGQSAVQDGKAAVSLAITGTEARTVAPAHAELDDVTGWKLLGAKTGGEQLPLTEALFTDPTGVTLHLETGDWDFTLEGYNESSLLILEGTKSQAISLEGPNTLNFIVAPVLEGTGTVRITINLPEEHGINQVKVFKDGELLDTRTLTPEVNSVVYENTAHAAGNYYFSFRLYKADAASPNPDLYGVVSELVKVRANLTSEGTYTLTAEDLNLSYLITFNLNGGGFANDPPDSYRSTDADLTLPEPAWLGYTFEGWYGNDGLGGDPVTKIPQDSAGDKPFWAKWTRLTYTIIYVLDEKGTNHGDNPTSYNVESPDITLQNPTPNGEYTFLYWYVDNPESADNTIPEGSTGEKTFYAKWHEKGQPLTSAADIGAYIVNAADEDNSAENPIELPPVTINLADGGWADLLSAISGAQKFVALDLSACDMGADVTEFDPGTDNTGEKFIASLTLPEAAISVKKGPSSSSPTFKNFTALTSVTGKEVVTIGEYAFGVSWPSSNPLKLKTVDFPEAINIGPNAFSYSATLETVNIPKATTIQAGAFNGCKALTEISLLEATIIDGFQDTGLIRVYFPKVITVTGYSFNLCTSLIEVDLPAATSIDQYAFLNCTALTEISLPSATSIGEYAFSNCTALETVDLPNAISIGNSAFQRCDALTEINLPKATSISARAFQNTGTDIALTVILGSAAPTVENYANIFNGVSNKTVIVKVPNKATGYDEAWENRFKHGGTNITLIIDEAEAKDP